MLGVGDEDIFPEDISSGLAVNNPSYGVNIYNYDLASSASGTSTDYLSVSVNPQYQFIGQAAGFSSTAKATSVDHMDHHLNGVSIPERKGRGRHVELIVDPSDISCKLSSTPYPLSSSAPPLTCASPVLDVTLSVNSSDNTSDEHCSYSYAQHHRAAILIPSNYVNSPHAAIEKRPHQYVLTPGGIKTHEEEVNNINPSVVPRSTSDSSSNMKWSRQDTLQSDVFMERTKLGLPEAKFELIIGLFSLLSIIVSMVAISLCVYIMFNESTPNIGSTDNQVILINDQSSTPRPAVYPAVSMCNCSCKSVSLCVSGVKGGGNDFLNNYADKQCLQL